LSLIRISIILLVNSLLLTGGAFAEKTYPDIESVNVLSVYDGDTFRVDIPDYPPVVGLNIPIRINAIDTPEIRGKCNKEKSLAIEAKKIVSDLLSNAKVVRLKNLKRGKYFRLVADVYADGVNVADRLIELELAVKYDGGKKNMNWCLSYEKRN